ncbi:MAG: SDR family oxidoreductase [SAR202 cluster bacterium]|nr:SDR family oxidoreductase [SAR202 cluster bacterium]
MDLELKGKAALVTGGSRGIGKAVAFALAREGADVAICSRHEAEAKAAAEEVAKATGAKVVGFPADTSKAHDIERVVAGTVKALGRLDILINNAARVGGTAPDSLATVTDDLIVSDFETKVLGYVRCAREAVPHMARNGWGRIVNVSGMAARMAGGVSGGMRNAAVANLTKVLADELGAQGINVNCVHPGAVVTELLQNRLQQQASARKVGTEQIEQQMAQNNAIRRIVTAEEIAVVIAFLCSPKAVSITGENIGVSGGGSRAVFY